jgi:hypothetical protein
MTKHPMQPLVRDEHGTARFKENAIVRLVQSFDYTFHGIKCQVFTTSASIEAYPDYPWRFRIEKNDGWIGFGGIPNYCESKRSAMMRAKSRCKWIADGTFNERYK